MILSGCAIMAGGIDYNYWKTFNLQRVFPKLQDALSVFPRATIYNRILVDWPTLKPSFALFQKNELERRLDTIYGAYLVALSKGAAPYQLADRAPKFKTVSFIVEQTGIDRGTVVAFLTSLEKLAKSGGVDLKYWNPDRAVQLNKAVAARIKEDVATAPKSPVVTAIADTASGLKWGGIGLLALVAALAVGKFIPGK